MVGEVTGEPHAGTGPLRRPRASERTTMVAACDPELPPLLMINGTNKASKTARAIWCSKYPIAVAVSISPANRTVSHAPLLRSME